MGAKETIAKLSMEFNSIEIRKDIRDGYYDVFMEVSGTWGTQSTHKTLTDAMRELSMLILLRAHNGDYSHNTNTINS